MLNAKDKATARCAIAHSSVIELVESVDERGKPKAFKAAAGVMTSLERLHQPIASYFYADAGAWLMSVDSAIAEAVMKAMLKRNIVVLPVHDSLFGASIESVRT